MLMIVVTVVRHSSDMVHCCAVTYCVRMAATSCSWYTVSRTELMLCVWRSSLIWVVQFRKKVGLISC